MPLAVLDVVFNILADLLLVSLQTCLRAPHVV